MQTNDGVFLYADIVDKHGTVIPDATNGVTFHVTGNAELVGENPRAAEAGTATILLKTGSKPGALTVTASGKWVALGQLKLVFGQEIPNP